LVLKFTFYVAEPVSYVYVLWARKLGIWFYVYCSTMPAIDVYIQDCRL